MKKLIFVVLVFQFLGCSRNCDYEFVVVNKLDKPIMIDHSSRGESVFIIQPNKEMKVSIAQGGRSYAEDIYKDNIYHFAYFKVYIIEEPILFNENAVLIDADFLDRDKWSFLEVSNWLGRYTLEINSDNIMSEER